MSSEIKVIDKAFQILNSFSEAQNNLSLKEIAKITSQNKSTIIRICRSLIKHNFLIKNESTGNYQLGPGAWKMGQIYNANFDIGNEIREILKDIISSAIKTAPHSESKHKIKIGSTVTHPKFGQGVVTGYEGNENDLRIQIKFSEHGVKWLAMEFAKLTTT